jgi:hypothetical protein
MPALPCAWGKSASFGKTSKASRLFSLPSTHRNGNGTRVYLAEAGQPSKLATPLTRVHHFAPLSYHLYSLLIGWGKGRRPFWEAIYVGGK